MIVIAKKPTIKNNILKMSISKTTKNRGKNMNIFNKILTILQQQLGYYNGYCGCIPGYIPHKC
jgi:hypothetical protein